MHCASSSMVQRPKRRRERYQIGWPAFSSTRQRSWRKQREACWGISTNLTVIRLQQALRTKLLRSLVEFRKAFAIQIEETIAHIEERSGRESGLG